RLMWRVSVRSSIPTISYRPNNSARRPTPGGYEKLNVRDVYKGLWRHASSKEVKEIVAEMLGADRLRREADGTLTIVAGSEEERSTFVDLYTGSRGQQFMLILYIYIYIYYLSLLSLFSLSLLSLFSLSSLSLLSLFSLSSLSLLSLFSLSSLSLSLSFYL